jgi:phosphoribosylamine---glycine ligase
LAESRNILIVGSGGREHALGWKILESPQAKKLFFAPGNGGTLENVGISSSEIQKLLVFAKQNECFTIVGPEIPLANGIVDSFNREGLDILGPTKGAAMLESSKIFAKKFMTKFNIPTAKFSSFSDPEQAKDYVLKQSNKLVVKADGLASGKGVMVCTNSAEAIDAIDKIMVKKEFGKSGNSIIIEDKLIGNECSFIALCDGETIIPMASSQDYKRLLENDEGPNTGGMGSLSPTPLIDKELYKNIIELIMKPTVRGMNQCGIPFRGFLYAGIMIEENTKKPYVLEFNARMGDPECQPIMLRLESDLLEYLVAAVKGELNTMPSFNWKNQFAVCIVMASRGYPSSYHKGNLIKGADQDFGSNIVLFHAATMRDRMNRLKANGGRVLGVTALGGTIKDAINNAYDVVKRISWGTDHMFYRADIARKFAHVDKEALSFL